MAQSLISRAFSLRQTTTTQTKVVSEGIRAHGMRRSRYIGLQRTHLAHVLTAAAINLTHVGAWLTGTPRAQTRHSRFARLMAQPAA
jgi:transposase